MHVLHTGRVCVVTSLPLTKWNLPIPCNIGQETQWVFQNWNGIFQTSEWSFTRGFMNELMADF